jgi:hypothetical protein
MFYNDHAPSHFHVQYGEFQAEMAIETLQILGWATAAPCPGHDP